MVMKELRKNKYKNNIENFKLYDTDNFIENFESKELNKWTDSPEEIKLKTDGLNKTQKSEVSDIVNQTTELKVRNMVTNQKVMFEGPQGPIGPAGPSGSDYIMSGKLANKETSTDESTKNFVVMRAQGEDDTGKAFMEVNNPFTSTQYWYLYKNGTLKNRFDNKCLTAKANSVNTSDLYMSECLPDENVNAINQKWDWEPKTNRIISKNKEANSQYDRCIALSGPKIDENTNLLAGCSNNSCGNNKKHFLQLKNCNNSVQPNEIWGFT